MQRKLRMGMVGGGEGAFIGAVHRIAANLDGQVELVCGAFSSDAERALRSGQALFLAPERCYASYQEMMTSEAALPADERMDFVAIVTPNHLHFPVAQAAIAQGFHVLSDKPATLNVDEVMKLRSLVEESDVLYGLTHTYTGYPLVKEARRLVAEGELGEVRKILVEYPQGWLAAPEENTDNKQAGWRLNPEQSGISSCMGDIGVHAFNLTEYISGLEVSEVCADLASIVPGRTLDDDGTVIMKFAGGARGVLVASQVAVGEENALKIRIYGDKAGLEWSQQEPNSLWIKSNDEPTKLLRTGGANLGEITMANTRTPSGHPEGYLEAFANLYNNFAGLLRAKLAGNTPDDSLDVPGIKEAVRGMVFIETIVAASNSEQKWHPMVAE